MAPSSTPLHPPFRGNCRATEGLGSLKGPDNFAKESSVCYGTALMPHMHGEDFKILSVLSKMAANINKKQQNANHDGKNQLYMPEPPLLFLDWFNSISF